MNALVNIETITAEKLFAPGAVEQIVSKLETDVRALSPESIETEEGRSAIKSLSYKIARSKTALDELGKEHVAVLKKQAAVIDADRRIIRDRLDALQAEVRKPLTDWENAEKVRVEVLGNAILDIRLAGDRLFGLGSVVLRDRLAVVNAALAVRDWQEFREQAETAINDTRSAIELALTEARKRESDEMELARLRAETLERAQKERDEAIAREAAEKATRDAQAKLEAERKRAAEQIAAANAREHEAAERLERAEREKEEAVAAERARAAAETKRLADEAAARELDHAHKRKINTAAVMALAKGGIPVEMAKQVITLIVRRMIPNVTISY